MKKTFFTLLLLVCGSYLFAQTADEKSLFERVSKIEKKNDYFNLYMNMHGSFLTIGRV